MNSLTVSIHEDGLELSVLVEGKLHSIKTERIIPHDIEHLLYKVGFTEAEEEEIEARAEDTFLDEAQEGDFLKLYYKGRNPEVDLTAWLDLFASADDGGPNFLFERMVAGSTLVAILVNNKVVIEHEDTARLYRLARLMENKALDKALIKWRSVKPGINISDACELIEEVCYIAKSLNRVEQYRNLFNIKQEILNRLLN